MNEEDLAHWGAVWPNKEKQVISPRMYLSYYVHSVGIKRSG
jgi:hypothetical protein